MQLAASAKTLVSSDGNGIPANGNSGRPALSSDGRYVAFTSSATNLAAQASSGQYNIYRKDRASDQILLASGPADGSVPNGDSQFPAICANGRYLAFASTSTNLTSLNLGPVNPDKFRVYVYDAAMKQTTLVSVNRNGFDADGDSRAPEFSADCTRIVFESRATDLVENDTNGASDVFVRDVSINTTTLVSEDGEGRSLAGDSTHADISADGNLVAFTSWAHNLDGAPTAFRPEVYLRNLSTAVTVPISAPFDQVGADVQGFSWPSFSADGRYLIFRSVTNPEDPSQRGRHVLVWDIRERKSAIRTPDGKASGWNDACVAGTNNGTNFSPTISNPHAAHSYLVLFPVERGGGCTLVLRDLQGADVPIRLPSTAQELIEPALNATGETLGWDLAATGNPQLVYACDVRNCSPG